MRPSKEREEEQAVCAAHLGLGRGASVLRGRQGPVLCDLVGHAEAGQTSPSGKWAAAEDWSSAGTWSELCFRKSPPIV